MPSTFDRQFVPGRQTVTAAEEYFFAAQMPARKKNRMCVVFLFV
jgi:hypothetical protein